MALTTGQSLSFYEILGPLGAGAMGEVYRARDTRLEREVALKVLPEHFADDLDRMKRFEREAKTLASLSHANLAHVYGIDQVEDTCFMAMELVPGEDLETRLARGRLPVDEAIDVCRQIAEGLEAAHEAGVVHRDLKPGNVRITSEGVVKILDFGLAKPIRPKATKDGTTTAESDSFLLTEEGLVLGTPTYMSPEQARGKPVDRRTDIWAFGCVLYECLTGERPFLGQSLPDVFASILSVEPDWSRLPSLPARVRDLLERTLTKDPRTRLRDAGEARVQLELARHAPIHDAVQGPARLSLGLGLALVLGAGAVGVVVGSLLGPGVEEPSAALGQEPSPARAICAVVHQFEEMDAPARIEISPDASQVAWTDGRGLHLRDLAVAEVRTLLEKDGLNQLAWSWDGQDLAYLDEGAIWYLAVEGGVPVRVTGFDGLPWTTLQWTPDGRIAYRTDGGVEAVTLDGERALLAPFEDPGADHIDAFRLLPDGTGALVVPHYDRSDRISVEAVRGGERREILELPTEPSWLAITSTGDILWVVGLRLWGARISLDTLELQGEPRVLSEDWTHVSPSLARDGTLAYLAPENEVTTELVAIDRVDGDVTSIHAHPRVEGGAFSPSGDKFAFAVRAAENCEIWIHDFERGTHASVFDTFEGTALPGFTRDGRLTVTPLFPMLGTYVYPETGEDAPERLASWLVAETPDQELRVVVDDVRALARGLGPTYVEGDGVEGGRRTLLEGKGECFSDLSEAGEWMLTIQDRYGRPKVFLVSFPEGHRRHPVSVGGGAWIAWFATDETEILYVSGRSVFRVAFESEPEVRLGIPERLFDLPPATTLSDYDGRGRFMGTRNLVWGRVYVDTGGLRFD